MSDERRHLIGVASRSAAQLVRIELVAAVAVRDRGQAVEQNARELRSELVAEIRRVDTRIDGLDRELRTAIDIRERLAALEARRPS